MDKTMIIGVGGAGCNMADTFRRAAKSSDIQNAIYVYAKKRGDKEIVSANDKNIIYLNPDKIAEPGDLEVDIFRDVTKVCVLAGLGGKTGTNWSPVIARLAKRRGIDYVVAVVTTPFSFEGEDRMKIASEGLKKIKASKIDLVITLNNDNLIEKFGNLDIFNAFDYADKAVLAAIEDSVYAQFSTDKNNYSNSIDELWKKFLIKLKSTSDSNVYYKFSILKPISFDDNKLIVEAPSQFYVELLESQLTHSIISIFKDVFGVHVHLYYKIASIKQDDNK